MRTKNVSTFNTESKGLSLLKEIFNFYFFKKGLLTNPVSTAGVFAKTKKELSSPDIQMLFAPASFENENAGTSGLERLDGITCGITPNVNSLSFDPPEAFIKTLKEKYLKIC